VSAASRAQPIVVGGTGGSGTRLVVQVLRELGVYMGSRVNRADDAVWMARFDWRFGRRIVRDERAAPRKRGLAVAGRTATIRAAFRVARTLHLRGYGGGRWGWKHPHSYLLIPFLHTVCPELRFIHLVRNGLDMATSANLRQLRRYGDLLLEPAEQGSDADVRAALFWSRANHVARHAGERLLGDRYVCLRFEDLCTHPAASISDLARRLGLEPAAAAVERAARLPAPPASMGRGSELAADVQATLRTAAHDGLLEFGYA
jgi:hypothetical protein